MTNAPQRTDPSDVSIHHGAAPAWQTIASLALVLHLFAIGVAAASSARIRSPLVYQLFSAVPGVEPYTVGLNLRWFSFQLTYGSDADFNHTCDLLVDWQPNSDDAADAPQGFDKLDLYTAQHAFPHLRLLRYQMLAMQVRERSLDDNASQAVLLPRAVVRSMLAEQGFTAGNYRFRCRTEEVPAPPYVEDPPPTPPNQNIARFDVTFFNGQAELTRLESVQQSAIVRGGFKTDPKKSTPQSNKPPAE